MKNLIVAMAVILGVVAVWGVGCTGDVSGTTGSLELYLSDSPTDAENVTGVYITVNEIQYHMNDEWMTCEGFEGPKTYDLLELTDGNSALLGELVLQGGHYNQIRFILDVPEMGPDPLTPGCYIEFADNSTEPLFVPSGNATGFKAVGEFTVPINGTVAVTADFDVRKSVHLADSHYILWPTIRLVVNNEAGRISGLITNNSTYTDIVVYAYEDGTWADAEADDPIYPASRFPNAVNSGKMCDDGHYTIPLLAAGTYDLVVAGYDGEDFGEVLGFVSDVTVESNHTTGQDIDTGALEASL
jgi:hypothetical protein